MCLLLTIIMLLMFLYFTIPEWGQPLVLVCLLLIAVLYLINRKYYINTYGTAKGSTMNFLAKFIAAGEGLEESAYDAKKIRCPYCGSISKQFIRKDRRAFSTGKALGGMLLLGKSGFLAGFFGKKEKRYYHCINCGRNFEIKK